MFKEYDVKADLGSGMTIYLRVVDGDARAEVSMGDDYYLPLSHEQLSMLQSVLRSLPKVKR